MLRLDRHLLLELAHRIEDNRDLWSLSETSKIWHEVSSQVMLPDRVTLEGPGNCLLSFAQLQQLQQLAKQLHRVTALKLAYLTLLPSDFFDRATALRSLKITDCTLVDLPQLPPKLTSLILLDSALFFIPPDLFSNATDLKDLCLDRIEGLKQISAFSPNLATLELKDLRDLTCLLPRLPPQLESLKVSYCGFEGPVPRELPRSLTALCWRTTADVDLGLSLDPYTNLQSLELAVEWSIHGLQNLSQLHFSLQDIMLTGSFNCPASITSLTSLTRLQIDLPPGGSVPSVLQPLHRLESLMLIPTPPSAALNDLTRLTFLSLRYVTPLAAPVSLFRLTALRRLSLMFDNELNDDAAAAAAINPIPSSLQCLSNLGELTIFVMEPAWCWPLPHLPCSLSTLDYQNCQLPALTEPPGCQLNGGDSNGRFPNGVS
jgi:hypothetical protein